MYFRIKKLEDAYYPGTPIVDYTLPAATVEGETVTPGNQTFIVWFTPNCISPQVYSRDILFTGWGGATCTVSASTVPGAVGSGSSTAVRINEFMLKNTRGLQDEFGRYVQWIEFYNTDMTQTVDLNGWQFTATDRNGVPATWTFPSATIAPGRYLVAMASDATPPTQYLNTGFPLDEQEGALALRNATGALSGMDEPLQYTADGSTDIAFCHSSETGMFTLTKTPTPYRANQVTKATFYSAYFMRDGTQEFTDPRTERKYFLPSDYDSYYLGMRSTMGSMETLTTTWFGEIANIATSHNCPIRLEGNWWDDNCPSHGLLGTRDCYRSKGLFTGARLKDAILDKPSVLQVDTHAWNDCLVVHTDDSRSGAIREENVYHDAIAREVDSSTQYTSIPPVNMVILHGCAAATGMRTIMSAFRPSCGTGYNPEKTKPYAALVLGWKNLTFKPHVKSFEMHFWRLMDGKEWIKTPDEVYTIMDAVSLAQKISSDNWFYIYDMYYGSHTDTARPDLLGTLEYKMKTREWLYGDNS